MVSTASSGLAAGSGPEGTPRDGVWAQIPLDRGGGVLYLDSLVHNGRMPTSQGCWKSKETVRLQDTGTEPGAQPALHDL